ncbi:MAG TPA: F0F1 ATP synthase subunit B [Longimicrobiales bacterium]|nr:F0F1 ATP synthase subunit B [Longimicrobiales bacterium]
MNLLSIVLAEGGSGGLFDINTGLMIWTVLIFLGLLAVLTKFAWRPILGALEARERRIQEILDAAARDREEAARLLEEHRQQLAEARQQSQQIIAEGRQAAERVKQELLEKARAEQEALIERTRQELERERERALEALRREAVDLSLAAASRLLETRLDSEQDRRVVREFLERIGNDHVRVEAH